VHVGARRLLVHVHDPRLRLVGEALRRLQARREDWRGQPELDRVRARERLAERRRTLWGALTRQSALFRIAAGRHQREVKALLGEDFAGIVGSDRWRAYDYLDPAQRQLCWAHLVRDFTAHSEGLAAQKQFGEAGLTIAERLFQAWEDYRQDSDRARLLEQIAPLQAELKALLEQAARQSTKTKYHRVFAKNLLKRWPALWTFAALDGVEPTNNRAERGLRGAVIYRKLSLGSQSEQGERTIERLLSASLTCRLQARSLFAYLADLHTASIRGDPIPLLAWASGGPERLPK
jgi:transposase